MRILAITAGAGGMYCGSCLRDNALAAELIARGHDVTLTPLYTPTLTDEPNVSQRRVFFGGVSVYLQQRSGLFRATPWALDRLWDAPGVLRAVSRRAIRTDPAVLGELTVSVLQGEQGRQKKELDKLLHWLRGEPPPDVVSLPNTLLIGLARPIREALGRPIGCTLQGEDLFLEGLSDSYRSQARELIAQQIDAVDAFMPVSAYYSAFMARYLGIPLEKMRVVPLGIRVDGYRTAPRSRSGPVTIGYLARIAPEKGLHALCEAFRRFRARPGAPPARLEAAGYLAPEHRDYLRAIEDRMREWGLAGEFRYRGSLDLEQKHAFLAGLDVFSMPAPYDEPKGLPVLEAMAAGVPVVQPRRGAFEEIVQNTGGGLLVEPDDPDALAGGLLQIATDPTLAEDLRRRGQAGVRERYSVGRMAARVLEVFQEMAAPC